MPTNQLLLTILALAFFASPLPLLIQGMGCKHAAWSAAGVMAACLTLLAPLVSPVLSGQTIVLFYSWLPSLGLNFSLRLDGLSLLFSLLITGIGLLVVLYAYYYLPKNDQLGRFYSILLLFMGAMLGVVLSENLILLVIFWEITSLSSFLLVAYNHQSHDSRTGARMALAITGGGGLALFAGILLLGHIVGSYELTTVLQAGERIRHHDLYAPMLVLILLGVFTKSAQFPFHFWLPNAMAAPTPVSAYLHSATMVKAGVFLLARLLPALAGTGLWFWLVSATGALTLVYAAGVALFRHDIKGLLAYSTISHLGLITLLFGLDTPLSAVAGVFHIINHAIFKASLFMAAGVVDHECGTRDMRRVNGMMRYMPITATLAIVAAASMAGVPLLNGFVSKEMFFAETVNHPAFTEVNWLLPLFSTIAGVLAVAYSSRFIHDIFFNGSPVNLPKVPHEPPRWMRLPIEILVVLCLLLGILPGWSVGPILAAAAAATLQAPLPEYKLAVWHGFNQPLVMSLLAMVGGMLVYALRAPLFAWNDKRRERSALSIFERLLDKISHYASRTLEIIDNGSVQRYCALLFVFILLFGVFAWSGATPANPNKSIEMPGVDALLAFSILAVSAFGATVFHRHRLLAIVLLGVSGLVVTIIFVQFSAPDLALTQLAVEAGTILLMLLVLYYFPKNPLPERFSARQLRDALIALCVGGGLGLVSWKMLITPFETISGFYLDQAVPGGGGTNVVNVILVDFRGFDTLGEITVLAMVALGAHVLLDGLVMKAPERDVEGRKWAEETHPLFLSMMMRPLLPLALTVSVFVFMRGHNVPGGGFVAGLITGVALIMQYLANGIGATHALMPRRPERLLSFGLLAASGIGLSSLFFGMPFLTSAHGYLDLPLIGSLELATAMVFDLGVYVVVVTVVLSVLSLLGRLSLRAIKESGDH